VPRQEYTQNVPSHVGVGRELCDGQLPTEAVASKRPVTFKVYKVCKSNSSTQAARHAVTPFPPARKAAHSCKAGTQSKAGLTHCNAPLSVNVEQVHHSCPDHLCGAATVYTVHGATPAIQVAVVQLLLDTAVQVHC
jgi:predicted RNA-binding Zn-ribbon protein involved in translation (DUF1610 family)